MTDTPWAAREGDAILHSWMLADVLGAVVGVVVGIGMRQTGADKGKPYGGRGIRCGVTRLKRCGNRTLLKNRTCGFKGSIWIGRRNCTTTLSGFMTRGWGGLRRRIRLG